MNTTIKTLALSAAMFAAAAVPAFGPLAAVASADTGLVKNGDFSQGTAHWTQGAVAALSVTPEQRLRVANTNTDGQMTSSGAYQCVELAGSGAYTISAKLFIEAGQLGGGAGQIGATFYPAAGCSGTGLGSEYTPEFRDVGVLSTQSRTITAPDGAVSARVRVMVTKDKSNLLPFLNQFAVQFDDVTFKKTNRITIDGPIFLPQATPTPKIVIDGPIFVPTATPTPKIQIVVPTKTVTPTATPTTPQIQNPPTKTPTATPTQPQIQNPPTNTPTPTPTQPQIQNPPTNTPTPTPEMVDEAEDEQDQDSSTPEAQEPTPSSQGGNSGQGSSGGDGGSATDTNTSTTDTSADDPSTNTGTNAEAADTSEQYTLENQASGRERGRGMGDVPGAGLVMPVARGVIGANELGLLGGGLALFGLLLAVVAFRRERRAAAE